MSSFARLVAPEDKPLSAKVVRNSLASGLRAMLVWPIMFLLVPFIIHKVGMRGYGTWAVLLAVISLSALGDMGVSGAMCKYTAEYYVRQDFTRLNKLVFTGVLLYFVISLLAVLLLTGFSGIIAHFMFRGAEVTGHELKILCFLTALNVGANFLSTPFGSVIQGLQRLDLRNALLYLKVLSAAALTVLFLEWGWGLRGLVYANLAAAFLCLVLSVLIMKRLLPQLAYMEGSFDRKEMSRVFHFSLRAYLTQIAATLDAQVGKLWLSLFTGMEVTGWFNLANDTAWKARGVPELILSPIIAAASELDAIRDESRLRELYFRSHKYLALFGVPFVFFLVSISTRFMELWVGPNLNLAAGALAVLVLAAYFNLTTGPGYLILTGRGILRPGVCSALFGLGINIVAGFLLTYFFGFWGAVASVCLATCGGAGLFFYLFWKEMRIPYGSVIRTAYAKPVFYSLILLWLFEAVSPPGHEGWVGLAARAVLFGVAYLAGLSISRFFDEFDLRTAENVLPLFRHARRVINVA